MTTEEKMVWAAAYTKNINYDYPPHMILEGRQKEWERGMICTAIECAYVAVVDLREAGEDVNENWGEDSEVYAMYREMTGAL